MTTSFKGWLEERRQMPSESGRLARDVAADPDWPDTSDLSDLELYLDWKGADQAAVGRLRYVHLIYEIETW